MGNKIVDIKEKLLDKYRKNIREKAIVKANTRIALAVKTVVSLMDAEVSITSLDGEAKFKTRLKQPGVIALLITLGLA